MWQNQDDAQVSPSETWASHQHARLSLLFDVELSGQKLSLLSAGVYNYDKVKW